jgi:hypothetical protein
MHLEACQEVSDELKGKIVALEARCAALYQGLQVYQAFSRCFDPAYAPSRLCATMRRYMLLYATVCCYMLLYAAICASLHATVCYYMLRYVTIWRYMLLYAAICCYMLVYASICC